MNNSELDEIGRLWDSNANDWDIQVGEDGDNNRRLNSDPILWKFLGDIRNLKVLDAGCGTGYLSKKLKEQGASVTGIDLSQEMIRIAGKKVPGVDFFVDSSSTLSRLSSGSFDIVVANYVLMDTPDLLGSLTSFNRVLKVNGMAVMIFSHPCFPQGTANVTEEEGKVTYIWDFPYFERRKVLDPPWKHFKSEFVWYHRPLSDYWKAFLRTGFQVVDLEEPRISPDRYHLAENERMLYKFRSRPYSIAFKLTKQNSQA